MAILIKGMEMPKDCIDCFAETYNVCMVTGRLVNSLGRPDWCPLVEVQKHGRLIDADELDKRIEEGGCCCTEEYAEWMGECIYTAPTVIEAERRE